MKKTTMILRKNIRKLAASVAVVGLILLSLAGCKDFSFFNELGVKGGLTITPASVSIVRNGIMSFNAYGGNGDCVFSIISGCGGSIDPDTGVYTAPSSACNEIVMATDSTNLSATATIKVVDFLDELEINPKVATLSPGGSITFVATGGNPASYDFSFGIDPPPSGGTITSGGVYTAGPNIGASDTIIVTDDDSTVCAIPASVSVVAAQTHVNYSVYDDTLPGIADAGSALSGNFTIENTGSANGSKPVSWWLYLSDDGSFGGDGETLVASNSTGYLDAGTNSPVSPAPAGNWPNQGGTFTLFIMISAEDDMTHIDDIYNAGTIDLTVPEIDYFISSVTNLDPTPQISEEVDGWFRLENNGADNSSQAAQWEVWLSADNSIGVGDTRLYAGTAATALSSGSTDDIYFNTTGFWPANAGSYYLIARVISAEDTAAGKDGNNDTPLGPITVTAPTVDYALTAVEHHGATEKVPGNSFDARFSYENAAVADNGISSLSWIAYISEDTTLGPEDILVDSGTGLSPLDAGASSGWINFSGIWPLHYGNYNIIVAITTPDNEPDLSDNEAASAPVSIGYYGEIAPTNDNWLDLPGPSPGTDYDILTGVNPSQPIALKPGMSLFIQGTNIGNIDRDDVYMFNTGTANKITFSVTWDSGSDDIDLFVWEPPGDFPHDILDVDGYTANVLAATIIEGTHYTGAQDLWFNVYCHIVNPPPTREVGPYEVVISAE